MEEQPHRVAEQSKLEKEDENLDGEHVANFSGIVQSDEKHEIAQSDEDQAQVDQNAQKVRPRNNHWTKKVSKRNCFVFADS